MWRKSLGGANIYTTNVTDNFLVQSDVLSLVDEHCGDLRRHFPTVKWCTFPTQFNGLKLTWVLGDDGRPDSCTVACPSKIDALVEMLEGIDAVRGRVGRRKITSELMTAAEQLAPELTERGRLTRKGTGLLQWMSPVRLDTKAFVQVLSRVMAAPSDDAAMLLDLVAASLYETKEDGITYTTGELYEPPVDAKHRTLGDDFDMENGSPAYPMMAFDSTWGEVRKSVASYAITCAGGAIDATTLTLPGSALSSAEAETYAFSWAPTPRTYSSHTGSMSPTRFVRSATIPQRWIWRRATRRLPTRAISIVGSHSTKTHVTQNPACSPRSKSTPTRTQWTTWESLYPATKLHHP